MSATTPRYGITYPTGSDLVSQAPTQFESMADTIENALANVDDRQTENAVKPVVRSTLAQLADASAVTGQTGYVTADSTSANNGAYVYNGSAWVKYAMKSDVDDLADQITQGYESGVANASTNQNGVVTVNWVRHSTSPQVMLVMLARTPTDELDRFLSPMVYELTNNGAQVRFRRNDSNAWAANQPTKFYWLALWK